MLQKCLLEVKKKKKRKRKNQYFNCYFKSPRSAGFIHRGSFLIPLLIFVTKWKEENDSPLRCDCRCSLQAVNYPRNFSSFSASCYGLIYFLFYFFLNRGQNFGLLVGINLNRGVSSELSDTQRWLQTADWSENIHLNNKSPVEESTKATISSNHKGLQAHQQHLFDISRVTPFL